ncbi:MAG: hypothetical protein WC538_10315, partial [Thermoanaerobaculia bacterium]
MNSNRDRRFFFLAMFLVSSALVLASQAEAAVSAIGAPTFATNTNTLSFTVPAGNDRILLVVASDDDATDVSTVSFGASSLTQRAEHNDGAAVDSVFTLSLGSSASSTTQTITVVSTGTTPNNSSFIAAAAFSGVSQAAPISNVQAVDNTTAPSASTLNVVSAAGDLVFDVFDTFTNSITPTNTVTPGAGQTVVHNVGTLTLNSTGFAYYRTSTSPGAASVPTSWTTTNGVALIHIAMNISAAPAADLAITKTDGVTTATPGGSTTYTITASNAGPSSTTATVADTFPASLTATWTCVGAGGGTCTASGSGNINDSVTLPSGGSVTYTASCNIAASATGTLSNTATVTGAATDPTPGNNSATDTDTLTPTANLGITKTDGVTSATAGGSVTYTITASNAGPSNASGSTVADTFPASLTATWTCVGAGGGTCTASGSGNI